jgi:hypothetical protein
MNKKSPEAALVRYSLGCRSQFCIGAINTVLVNQKKIETSRAQKTKSGTRNRSKKSETEKNLNKIRGKSGWLDFFGTPGKIRARGGCCRRAFYRRTYSLASQPLSTRRSRPLPTSPAFSLSHLLTHFARASISPTMSTGTAWLRTKRKRVQENRLTWSIMVRHECLALSDPRAGP